MTFKEILEIIAAGLTIIVSAVFLYGFFAAHKKGFFKSLHTVVDYYRDLIEAKPERKQR